MEANAAAGSPYPKYNPAHTTPNGMSRINARVNRALRRRVSSSSPGIETLRSTQPAGSRLAAQRASQRTACEPAAGPGSPASRMYLRFATVLVRNGSLALADMSDLRIEYAVIG